MNLVHEKTEVLLKSFIEKIKPKQQSWRLINIEFQNCDTLNSSLFQNLCLKNLHFFFKESDCTIFWHKPGFVLIFFQGRALPIEKCVEGFLKETEFKGFGRFFDILDLSIDWENLEKFLLRLEAPIPAPTIVPKTQTSEFKISEEFKFDLVSDKIRSLSRIRSGRVKPLILLVEDDPFTLQLVKLAFKDKFDIITAETARQALVFYQRHLPDMVFLDIQLPDGNGIDLLQKMTKADDNAYIIMLSSHSQKEKILDCISNGSKGFIGKPFTKQRLLDATEKFLISKSQSLTGSDRHGT
jgi:two-component system, chemotaxis family, chemotaxis protein CheY